uniref:2-oxoglutarate and iron-dependent oxygenase JMJD4 n=1 Tax=Ficedula albicollis TaxID=59894 RepID=U3JEE8_FICAL
MDRATFACSTAFFRDFGNSAPGALPGGHVDFIDKADSFTYSDFFRDYLIPNHPCIFSAKFTEDWGSRKTWVTRDGKPNFEHLLQKFGEAVVPVANCDVKEYNSNPKEQLPFKEFVEYWREYIRNGYRSSRGCLYLKDWHLSRAFPEQDVYTTPVYFSSDWLNEYWDAVAVDDFRFVYMGPKGSWTPFHADVFRSYSWSANVCGRKKWLLYPAGQEEFLKDCHGNLPFDVTAPDLGDKRIYPRYSQSQPPLEIIQEAGEIVFIPSGWHHQVYNLEDTISINHNWVNGCNVAVMWCFLQDELAAVQREISQWKEPMDDWHLQCQVHPNPRLSRNSGIAGVEDLHSGIAVVYKEEGVGDSFVLLGNIPDKSLGTFPIKVWELLRFVGCVQGGMLVGKLENFRIKRAGDVHLEKGKFQGDTSELLPEPKDTPEKLERDLG